jgi:salicylate hydroxylase
MSTANKRRFHLADGPEQRERDTEMSAGSTDWSFGAVAWIYEHDASGVVLPPRVKP